MDFIFNVNIYIENVWCGFSRKDPSKRVLEKFFIKDTDYKIVIRQSVENSAIPIKLFPVSVSSPVLLRRWLIFIFKISFFLN